MVALHSTLLFFPISDGNSRIWRLPSEVAGRSPRGAAGAGADRLRTTGSIPAPFPSLGGFQVPQFTGTPQYPWIPPFRIHPKGQGDLGTTSGARPP